MRHVAIVRFGIIGVHVSENRLSSASCVTEMLVDLWIDIPEIVVTLDQGDGKMVQALCRVLGNG